MKAIKLLSFDKAPGSDAISAEVYKAGGPLVADKLTFLFHMWIKEAIPKHSRMHQLSTYSNGMGSLWHSFGHLFKVNSREDPRKIPTEPIKWTPWTVRASTRKQMEIKEGQKYNRHDLHSKATSRETPETEYGPISDLCRPYQRIWHRQSWGTLENYGKGVLSGQVHNNGAAVLWWNACTDPK